MSLDENVVFRSILRKVAVGGKESAPRGLKIKELTDFMYDLPPYVRFMNFAARKLNINYIKKEFLWYLRGDKYDTSICDHAAMWKGLINNDGSINSNYGQYIFGEQQQFWNVVKTLRADKDSRRASIMILNSGHLQSDTKDVPCTYTINFRIRDNSLDMTVHMRSQDAIYGMGNDAPAFSFIHEMMYHVLRADYPELKYGWYHHTADSFHVYERHFDMLRKIAVEHDPFVEVDVPPIKDNGEVLFLIKGDFSIIPEEYKFARWLNEE